MLKENIKKTEQNLLNTFGEQHITDLNKTYDVIDSHGLRNMWILFKEMQEYEQITSEEGTVFYEAFNGGRIDEIIWRNLSISIKAYIITTIIEWTDVRHKIIKNKNNNITAFDMKK